jgi:hypothetical protein
MFRGYQATARVARGQAPIGANLGLCWLVALTETEERMDTEDQEAKKQAGM